MAKSDYVLGRSLCKKAVLASSSRQIVVVGAYRSWKGGVRYTDPHFHGYPSHWPSQRGRTKCLYRIRVTPKEMRMDDTRRMSEAERLRQAKIDIAAAAVYGINTLLRERTEYGHPMAYTCTDSERSVQVTMELDGHLCVFEFTVRELQAC